MKRIALVMALVAIAACNKSDKSGTTDTTGGQIAPPSDSSSASASKVKGPRTAAQATADSIHMATSGSSSTAAPAPDSTKMGGKSDTTKKTP